MLNNAMHMMLVPPTCSQLRFLAPALVLYLAPSLVSAQALGPCTIETVAGGASTPVGDGGPAVDAELYGPSDVRVGPDGSLYIADTRHGVVRRVTTEGVIETFAGGGERTLDREPMPAKEASRLGAFSMAVVPDGTLYFVGASHRILRVTPDGIISWFAGSRPQWRCIGGTCDFFEAEGPAIDVFLGLDMSITVDGNGNLYVAALQHHVVRKITPDGMLTTVAGTGVAGLSEDGGLATETPLWKPRDVAVVSVGNIYILEGRRTSLRIRRVRPDGVIETYLRSGFGDSSPDDTLRQDAGVRPTERIELDGEGRLYWGEQGPLRYSGLLRRVAADDTLETVVSSDVESGVIVPFSFSVDSSGELYFFLGDQVSRFSTEEGFVVVAGVGLTAARGDGGPALEARIGRIKGLALGPGGEVYFVDQEFNRVRALMPDGTVQRVAGTGESVFGGDGDGGPAPDARLREPEDVAVDSEGNLYIAEPRSIRKVETGGIINTIAGTGFSCFDRGCGDGGPALEAELENLRQIVVDRHGNLYILQNAGQRRVSRIRKVAPDGTIDAVDLSLSSDGTFDRDVLYAMTLDAEDNLIVSASFQPSFTEADRLGVWSIGPDGVVSPLPCTEGFVGESRALAQDGSGNTYMVGFFACTSATIGRLTPDGVLNTITGLRLPSCAGFEGDGGPAADALLGTIESLLVDGAGNLYVSDRGNRRLRRINRADQCAVIRRPQIAWRGVVHGASFSALSTGAHSALTPGLIFSIFGKGLGPEDLRSAQLGEDDRLTTELVGTRILIDGVPAPMVFSVANQISGIVPYRIVADADARVPRRATLEVEYLGVRSEPTQIAVSESNPGIFTLDATGSGQGAILNQDGSVNGPENPAAPGSIIVLFATGEGSTEPPGVDGAIAAPPLPKPILPVSVTIGGAEAEVLYAGAAPSLVLGVLQVNARVPVRSRLGTVDVNLRVGSAPSRSAKVVIGQ